MSTERSVIVKNYNTWIYFNYFNYFNYVFSEAQLISLRDKQFYIYILKLGIICRRRKLYDSLLLRNELCLAIRTLRCNTCLCVITRATNIHKNRILPKVDIQPLLNLSIMRIVLFMTPSPTSSSFESPRIIVLKTLELSTMYQQCIRIGWNKQN